MSWLDSFFRGNAGATGPSGVASVTSPLTTDGSTLGIFAASSDGPGTMSVADKVKLDRINISAGQPTWTVGPAGLAASTLGTTYYELLWANRCGQTLAVAGAYINGGRDGMSIDAVNTTTIALVKRALDGSGSDTAMGAYANDSVALTAKGDSSISLSPSTVADGLGVFVKITRASSGTNLGPGTRVYLTF